MATDNEKKTLDYGAFLADLEAKRAVLDQAIASLKAVMAAGNTEGMSSVNLGATLVNPVMHGGEVPAGAFHGLKIPEAAKMYLSIVNKKQTTKEIADGLLQGGMETAGKNFEIIVGSGLYRISKGADREIVRLKGGWWGLAKWWPAGLGAGQEKPNGRKTKRARKHKSVKSTDMEAALQFNIESNGHKKPQERIADFLRGNPTKSYTPKEVSQELGIDMYTAGPTLGRLAAKKVAEKIESGKYRAAHG